MRMCKDEFWGKMYCINKSFIKKIKRKHLARKIFRILSI